MIAHEHMKKTSKVTASDGVPTRLLLYVNQILFQRNDRYAAKTLNFIDFISAIANGSTDCKVACPTDDAPIDAQSYPEVLLNPKNVIELPSYSGHAMALLASFRQARQLKRATAHATANCVVAGPGPNSMLWLLSLIMPKSTRFAFFIRGNTAHTLRHIYRRHVLRPIVMTLVNMFENRIRTLQRSGRAVVFAMGPELVDRYQIAGPTHCILPLLHTDSILSDPPRRESNGPTRLLCLGRLSAEKNISALIEAVDILRQRSIDVSLTITGDGEQRPALEQLTQRLNLQQHVTFAGFVPHGPAVRTLLDEHDRLVLCSFTEGVPRSIIEAFARWLPVIATRVGSLPRLFANEIAWAHDTSSSSIATAIDQSIANPEAARAMTERAHEELDAFRIDLEAERVGAMLRDPATWDRT